MLNVAYHCWLKVCQCFLLLLLFSLSTSASIALLFLFFVQYIRVICCFYDLGFSLEIATIDVGNQGRSMNANGPVKLHAWLDVAWLFWLNLSRIQNGGISDPIQAWFWVLWCLGRKPKAHFYGLVVVTWLHICHTILPPFLG